MPLAHMQQKNAFPAKVLRFDWTGLGHTLSPEPITVEGEVGCRNLLIPVHVLHLWMLDRWLLGTTESQEKKQ